MANFKVTDVDGRDLCKGDTVATVNGAFTGKVCDVVMDGDVGFVRLRAVHAPFSKGVWHAADRVQIISAGKRG